MSNTNSFEAWPIPLGPQQPIPDFLHQAVSGVTPTEQPRAPLPITAADLTWKAEEARAAEAEAASNKMAQEALAANPAELRQMFPKVYADVSTNHNNHLDMDEIDAALNSGKLDQNETNYLTVLKAGYNELSVGPMPAHLYSRKLPVDDYGISADSLAMLDKAVNRGIKEDPFFWTAVETVPKAALVFGAIAAGAVAYKTRDVKAAAIGGVVSAAAALVWGEGSAIITKYSGLEDYIVYDPIKTDYQSFLADFDKGQSGGK